MRSFRVLCVCLMATALLTLPAIAADGTKDGKVGHGAVVKKPGVKNPVGSNETINTCFVNCGSATQAQSLQEFLLSLTDLTPNESCCQHCLDTCHVTHCTSTQGSETIHCFSN